MLDFQKLRCTQTIDQGIPCSKTLKDDVLIIIQILQCIFE